MRRILSFVFLVGFFLISYLYNNNLKFQIKAAENRVKLQKERAEKKYVEPSIEEEVFFYYPNDSLTELIREKTKLPKVKDTREKLNFILGFIKEKTKDLKKYNNSSDFKFIDSYLEIENVYYDKGILYIDFNEDFRKEIVDKRHEIYLTYTIVNSFMEIKGIEKIKFLILGKEVNELKYYKLDNFLYKYNLRG